MAITQYINTDKIFLRPKKKKPTHFTVQTYNLSPKKNAIDAVYSKILKKITTGVYTKVHDLVNFLISALETHIAHFFTSFRRDHAERSPFPRQSQYNSYRRKLFLISYAIYK